MVDIEIDTENDEKRKLNLNSVVEFVPTSYSIEDSVHGTIASPEEHIWKNKVLLSVITVPRNAERMKALDENLKSYCFPSPYIHYGIQFSKDSTVGEKDKVIAFGHYSLTKIFCDWNTERKYHLMVMEDDCKFYRDNPTQKIERHLNYLDKYRPEWRILFIGHVPMGPVWFTQWGLINTQQPFTGHCYILNGKHLPELINTIPLDKWQRCTANEAWRTIPASQKFAIFPALATQTDMPKEMGKMFLVNKFSASTWFQCIEWCMVVVTILIILIFIFVVILFLTVVTHYVSIFISSL